MSGAFVPYHQRQNKGVDRLVFIDLLTKINRARPIGDYRYISFGGPYLEDFKLIHSQFGNDDLISIENDPIALGRQSFNRPLNCIQCKGLDSAAFVDNYEAEKNSIIWLDYADPKKTAEQINEFQALLSKLMSYDILKITLNANPGALRADGMYTNGKRETKEECQNMRLEKLKQRLGDHLPPSTTAVDMTKDGLPEVLSRAIEHAANSVMSSRRLTKEIFQPLLSFVYSDSDHQMLTITGIILPKGSKGNFLRETNISRWKLAATKWGEVKRIMVPALTAREKLFIDQCLPKSSGKQIQGKLKFLFDKQPAISVNIIDSYRMFYRHYPNFQRVLL